MRKLRWHSRYWNAVIHQFGKRNLKMDYHMKRMFKKYYYDRLKEEKNAKVKVQFD
jgi:uncharacterized protein (DUF302 family)